MWYVTDTGFEFPVPIEDTGDTEFFNEDKAMWFMRYIRGHIEKIATARQEQDVSKKEGEHDENGNGERVRPW